MKNVWSKGALAETTIKVQVEKNRILAKFSMNLTILAKVTLATMFLYLERQRRLMEMKLQAKKLKKEGKFDELARLLGSSAANAENLSKRLGENRENYMNKLNER